MNDGLLMAAIVIGFPLVAWAFGWSLLGRFTSLDPEERFAASWGVSFAFLALRQFLGFVIHAEPRLFNLVTLALMLLTVVLCRPCWQEMLAGKGLRLLVAAWALAYLHLVCIQALLPNYRGSNWYFDWWMHYDEALVFVGDRPPDATWSHYTLASRTPLFNLVTASVMSLAGHGFAVYQLASALTNCAFIPAVYLVLRDLFGPRAARLTLLLAPLNLWMLHNAWFTWPKMLTAYFLLLGLHFYLQWLRQRATEPKQASRLFLYFWVSSLLGVMTHQVALVYLLPLLLHAGVLAFRDRAYRPTVTDLAGLVLALVVVAEPWYGWLAGTLGVDKIMGTSPVTLGDTSAVFRPFSMLLWVSSNTLASLVPVSLLIAPFRAIISDSSLWRELYRGLTELYFSLLTGAVTLSLTAFLAYTWRAHLARSVSFVWDRWKRLRRKAPAPPRTTAETGSGTNGKKETAPPLLTSPGSPGSAAEDRRREWTAVWLFALLGALGAAVLHPGKMPWGIAHSAAFPTAILLTALAWGLLSRADRRTGLLVCSGIVAEFLLMFWSHWSLLIHRPEVLEDLDGNAYYKSEAGISFLNDVLGGGQYLFLAGAVAIQFVLCLLLVRYWRSRDSAPSATESSVQASAVSA